MEIDFNPLDGRNHGFLVGFSLVEDDNGFESIALGLGRSHTSSVVETVAEGSETDGAVGEIRLWCASF